MHVNTNIAACAQNIAVCCCVQNNCKPLWTIFCEATNSLVCHTVICARIAASGDLI